MKTITYKQLKLLGACEEQLNIFKETFGESVSFNSLEKAKEIALKYAQKFDFDWLGNRLFGEAYKEAEAPLWKAYEEARAPLWKAYEEAEAPLWKAYKEAVAPLWEAYEEAEAPLLKAYEEAVAPLWEAYKEAVAELFAEMYWNM